MSPWAHPLQRWDPHRDVLSPHHAFHLPGLLCALALGHFFPQMKLDAWGAVGGLHHFSTSANKTATWPFCLMTNRCFHLTQNPNPSDSLYLLS